jgi:hypothetical protein
MADRKIIVITPVRSEEISRTYPKVHYFKSGMEAFSERERRNELLGEARKLGRGNVIISLDADELLSPDFISKSHLETLRNLGQGTRIGLPFFNLRPGCQHYWTVPQDPIGFVDDGALHEHNLEIHFQRVPGAVGSPIYRKEGAGILHLQYIDWARMESKHLWYRVLERVTFPKKSALEIERRYNHMYAIPATKLLHSPEMWNRYFAKIGIDLEGLGAPRGSYWWDEETRKLVENHHRGAFKYIDLRPIYPDSIPSKDEERFWAFVRRTTALTGLTRLDPRRISLLLLDLVLRRFWR